MKRDNVQIWTDGSTNPKNPGEYGGWGAVLLYGGVLRIKSGVLNDGLAYTNNMMETKAVIEGVSLLTKKCNITLYTDSSYVATGIRKWQKRGRLHQTNMDYWKELALALRGHTITVNEVLGHSGTAQNELAHKLAYYAAKYRIVFDDYFKSLDEARENIIDEVKSKQGKLS